MCSCKSSPFYRPDALARWAPHRRETVLQLCGPTGEAKEREATDSDSSIQTRHCATRGSPGINSRSKSTKSACSADWPQGLVAKTVLQWNPGL